MPQPPTQADPLRRGLLPAAGPHGRVWSDVPHGVGAGVRASVGATLGVRCRTCAGYTSERWVRGGCGCTCVWEAVDAHGVYSRRYTYVSGV